MSSIGAILNLVVPLPDEPQDGVNEEEGEHAGKQQVHEQADKIQRRIQLAVARVGVRLILNKAQVGADMALAASFYQVGLVDRRIGI